MRQVYNEITRLTGSDMLLLSSFPMLGVGDFFLPDTLKDEFKERDELASKNIFSDSLYFNDYCINPHPRFGLFLK